MSHLTGRNGKALTGIAGTRRLDGGVKGERIGLLSDVVVQIDYVAGLLRHISQILDRFARLLAKG